MEKKYILALNVGSTSLKSKLFELKKGGVLKEIFNWGKSDIKANASKKKVLSELSKELKRKNLFKDIIGVGHRVVHGGPITESSLISKEIINSIKKNSELAPLHNPYNLEGIIFSQHKLKKIPQVAVFDTAFYSKMPSYASSYALPLKLSEKLKIRRYGFHGISHKYAAIRASKLLKKPLSSLKLITVHLGGGSSITAISKGRAIDTSMGFTPLEGLIMSTRTGDIDPGIVFFLANKGYKFNEINNLMVNKSGILGLSGSKNMLNLLKNYKERSKKAVLAFDMFVYRIQKYIGAYFAVLGGCDALVFTGAVGAGERITRRSISDPLKNGILKKAKIITINPDEERMIAEETLCQINSNHLNY